MAHKFMIGQTVDLTPKKLRQAAAGEYEILRLMPATENNPEDPCYRIKSIAENYERAVCESDISLSRQFDSILS